MTGAYDSPRKLRLTKPFTSNWTCTHCHWSNPKLCKFCANCRKQRKEEPCTTQVNTPPQTATGDPQT